MFSRKPATLTDARKAFQNVKNYWDSRIRIGDPLFDQWMVDSLESAEEGLALLDRMETLGHETGRFTVETSLKPFKKIAVYIREMPFFKEPTIKNYEYTIVLDNSTRIIGHKTIEAFEHIEAKMEEKVRAHYAKDIGKKTKVTVKKLSDRAYYLMGL